MRPPTIALLYPIQRKLTGHSITNDNEINTFSCARLQDHYNKCILKDSNNCKDSYDLLLLKCKNNQSMR